MATLTAAGATPSDPTTIRNAMVTAASALSPGLTANLPGSLIEDMASTATGGCVVCDQAFVDLVNSISPITANLAILTQLGNTYGVQQGIGANTSVEVTFTGTVGFVINRGFLVSDGTNTYQVQDSTIVPSGGTTPPVYCLALTAGSFAVPASTVTAIASSVPTGITLTCTNPTAGVPGSAAQDPNQFRAQVIQAGNAVGTGIGAFVKTTIGNVPNVNARLIAFRVAAGGYEIIVGGGDQYLVANAIYQSLFNIIDLKPKQTIGTTVTVTIDDYPDSYAITFVQPAIQTVAITVNWETISLSNFVSNTVVASAVQPALAAYIHSIPVGQPISLLMLVETFTTATAGIIMPQFISELVWTVVVNSVTITPTQYIYAADPEGYFYTDPSGSGITVTNT